MVMKGSDSTSSFSFFPAGGGDFDDEWTEKYCGFFG